MGRVLDVMEEWVTFGDWKTVLLYFIGRGYDEGASVSVMRKKVASISFWLKVKGIQDASKAFLVRQALRGYGRDKKVQKRLEFWVFGCCVCWTEW